jgi:WD40 repeat protein
MKISHPLSFIIICLFAGFPVFAQRDMQVKFPVTPTGFYANVEFSNNGKLILFSEHQRTFLTDAFTYRTVADFKNTSASTFSNDSRYLLITWNDRVDVWEVGRQQTIYSFTAAAKNTIQKAALTADSKYLVIVLAGGSWPVETSLLTIDIRTKEQLRQVQLDQSYPFVVTGSTSHLVALYDFSGKADVYDLDLGKQLYRLNTGKDTVRSIAFNPDDRLLAVTTGDQNIRLYDATTGKQKSIITGHSATVTSASFSHDGKMIVSASMDRSIRTWNAASGKLLKEFKEDGPVYRASFSQKDNYIIASMEYEWLNIRNVATGKKHNPEFLEMAKYAGPKQISPDEQLYYASSQVLKLANAETVYQFKQEVEPVKTTAMSANGRYIATLRGHDNVSIWDLALGGLAADFGMPDTSRYQMFVADITFWNNENLLIGWTNGELWKWNIEKNKGEKINTISGGIGQLVMNREAGKLLIVSDSVITAFNTTAFSKLFSFRHDSFRISLQSVVFSRDNSLLAVSGASNKKVFILNAENGQLISAIEKHGWNGRPIITPDKKKLVMLYDDAVSYVYSIETGKETAKLQHTWSNVQQTDAFMDEWAGTDDNSSVLMAFGIAKYGDQQTYLQSWDLNTGAKLKSAPFTPFTGLEEISNGYVAYRGDSLFLLDQNNLQRLRTVPGNKLLVDTVNKRIIAQNEFSLDLYSYTLDKIATLASFDNAGGIIVLADNYYKADRGAIPKIHFQQGLNIISVSQLDLLLNRPDKVLQALGSTDTALVRTYKLAFEKRLKKLGLTEQQLLQHSAVPVAAVTNRNSIPAEQQSPNISLKVKAYDSASFIDHYNVWINDVPVFGSGGVNIAKKHLQRFEDNITLELSKGANRIEFAVVNSEGKESYRQPLDVYLGTKKTLEQTHGYQSYDANAPKEGTVYFIGIGIDHFKDSSYNLQWSVKDIRDLAENFATKNFGWNTVIDTLFNEQVTVANIMALKKKLMNTTVNDKVILSYSGHGLLNDNLDYYLSTYDINFQKPEQLGLAYTMLESLFDAIPARKKLVLIDACHSGEVDKDEIIKIQAAKPMLDSMGTKAKSSIGISRKRSLGMANSFEVMQNSFVNMGKGTGATIISAAGGMQYAQERGDLKNGVFTYSVLEAMRQNDSLTVSQLKKIIAARVTQLTDGLQKPTSRNETSNYDWAVW